MRRVGAGADPGEVVQGRGIFEGRVSELPLALLHHETLLLTSTKAISSRRA